MKIVVPLDGSTAAEAALPEALNRVKRHAGARLVLVRAVDPASVPRSTGSGEQARAISEAAEYLRRVAARLRGEGIDRVGRAVWFAPPRLAIAEAIRTMRPDLIVMCDRGRDGESGPRSFAGLIPRHVSTPVVFVTSPEDTVGDRRLVQGAASGPLNTRFALGTLDGPTRRVHVESQHLEGRYQKHRAGGVTRQKV